MTNTFLFRIAGFFLKQITENFSSRSCNADPDMIEIGGIMYAALGVDLETTSMTQVLAGRW